MEIDKDKLEIDEALIIEILIAIKKLKSFRLLAGDIVVHRLLYALRDKIHCNDFEETDFGLFSKKIYKHLVYLIEQKILENTLEGYAINKKEIKKINLNGRNDIFDDYFNELAKKTKGNRLDMLKIILSSRIRRW